MTKLLLGNNKDLLEEMENGSIDALITDPPYLINFMGKDWDKENSPAGDKDFWALVLKKMKPGAHGVVFGHSRQHHRVMTALEDAGFEIRDCLMWLYGSGFPKSHNVGKAIDSFQKTGKSNPKSLKEVEQEHGGESYELRGKNNGIMGEEKVWDRKKYETQTGWEGWGTALKPAYEPIILVRRPIEKKLTVAKNVLKHGVGGINIDASRVGSETRTNNPTSPSGLQPHYKGGWKPGNEPKTVQGRFPANVMLDEEAGKILNEQVKEANRFFYCPKVSKKERNAAGKNTHPTVKPIALMKYLVKLITPQGGKVLDPFMGSGSTGMACVELGNSFIGMEREVEYYEIATDRIEHTKENKDAS